MTTVDFTDLGLAVAYSAASILTWGGEKDIQSTELMRRRWLRRHMTESAKEGL